jgi:hypothetical protein
MRRPIVLLISMSVSAAFAQSAFRRMFDANDTTGTASRMRMHVDGSVTLIAQFAAGAKLLSLKPRAGETQRQSSEA